MTGAVAGLGVVGLLAMCCLLSALYACSIVLARRVPPSRPIAQAVPVTVGSVKQLAAAPLPHEPANATSSTSQQAPSAQHLGARVASRHHLTFATRAHALGVAASGGGVVDIAVGVWSAGAGASSSESEGETSPVLAETPRV